MGLDMYAWKTKSEDLRQENENDVDLANWRKHNRLHGFMQMLWEEQGCPNPNGDIPETFNCVPIELDEIDLNRLQKYIKEKNLPDTQGFFFGQDSYDYDTEEVKEQDAYDLLFVKNGLQAIKDGYKVVYDSWW